MLNVTTGSWQLPTPALRVVGAGWQLDAALTRRSGAPVSVSVSRSLGGVFHTVRPGVVPGAPQWIADPSSATGERINAAAFVIPEAARQGTLGRNTLIASPLRELDLALSRTVRLNHVSGNRPSGLQVDHFPSGEWITFQAARPTGGLHGP